jgi:hypothetical protein
MGLILQLVLVQVEMKITMGRNPIISLGEKNTSMRLRATPSLLKNALQKKKS